MSNVVSFRQPLPPDVPAPDPADAPSVDDRRQADGSMGVILWTAFAMVGGFGILLGCVVKALWP